MQKDKTAACYSEKNFGENMQAINPFTKKQLIMINCINTLKP